MQKIIIQDSTTKKPISLMGYEAGVCWESDIANDEANIKRGLDCIESGHGRLMELP